MHLVTLCRLASNSFLPYREKSSAVCSCIVAGLIRVERAWYGAFSGLRSSYCCSSSFRLRLDAHGEVFVSRWYPQDFDDVAVLLGSFGLLVDLSYSALAQLLLRLCNHFQHRSAAHHNSELPMMEPIGHISERHRYSFHFCRIRVLFLSRTNRNGVSSRHIVCSVPQCIAENISHTYPSCLLGGARRHQNAFHSAGCFCRQFSVEVVPDL